MNATASDSTIPTLWLRSAEDIRLHLRFAASSIQVCVLSVRQQQVYGTFGCLDERGEFEFRAHSRLAGILIPPRKGDAVRADYEAATDRYSFYSEVVRVEGPMRWCLAAPTTVERKDKRMSRRIQLAGHPGFSLRLQVGKRMEEFPVLDLSSGGVGFSFDPLKTALTKGAIVPGTLEIPGHRAVEVKLEIRHARIVDGVCLVGTRFRQVAYSDRMAIRRLVSAWGR